jgi:prepilin-type processing-associated H-X9-DG protein
VDTAIFHFPARARSSRPKAFTLIDLLVVSAVVSVLAAMLLATVSRTKASAVSARCQSNLREMGVALNTFVTDFKVFPLSSNPELFRGQFPEHKSGWFDALSAQLSHQIFNTNGTARTQDGVFDCPAAAVPAGWPKAWEYSDYGYNANGLGDTRSNLGLGGRIWNDDWQAALQPTPESEVRAAVDMMALGDGFRGSFTIQDGSPLLGRILAMPPGPEDGANRRSLNRHRGRANVTFCDGHVEAVGLPALFSNTGDEALRRWNKDNLPHRERLN